MGDKLNVYWTYDARRRLWTLIDNVKTEVGGFGYAALENDGTELIWYDVFLVPQEVTSGSVDYDGAGLEYAVERAARDGVLGKPDHVWVSWHSHHNMGAFWSPTDEDCIDTYGKAGPPVLLSFVGTHSHEYKARVDFFSVRHHGITIPKVTMGDLSIGLDGEEPVDPFVEAIRGEIDEYVKKPHTIVYRGGQSQTGTKKSGWGNIGRRRTPTALEQTVEEAEAQERPDVRPAPQGEQLWLIQNDDDEVVVGEFGNVGGRLVGDYAWDDPDAALAEIEGESESKSWWSEWGWSD